MTLIDDVFLSLPTPKNETRQISKEYFEKKKHFEKKKMTHGTFTTCTDTCENN